MLLASMYFCSTRSSSSSSSTDEPSYDRVFRGCEALFAAAAALSFWADAMMAACIGVSSDATRCVNARRLPASMALPYMSCRGSESNGTVLAGYSRNGNVYGFSPRM